MVEEVPSGLEDLLANEHQSFLEVCFTYSITSFLHPLSSPLVPSVSVSSEVDQSLVPRFDIVIELMFVLLLVLLLCCCIVAVLLLLHCPCCHAPSCYYTPCLI